MKRITNCNFHRTSVSANASARDPFERKWLKYIDPEGKLDANKVLPQLIQICTPRQTASPGPYAEAARKNIKMALHLLLNGTVIQGGTTSENLILLRDFSSVTWPILDRGRLYSSLIAIASNQDLKEKASAEGAEGGALSLSHLKLAKLSVRKLRRSGPVGDRSPTSIASILWEIIEEDEDFMTLLLLQPNQFRKYPVPYFQDCDQNLVDSISNLWLSPSGDNEFGVVNFYKHVFFKPIVVDELRDETLTREDLLANENIGKAKNMLCLAIMKRGAKEGARFLQMLLQFYRYDYCKLGDMVKEVFIRPCDYLFRAHFLKVKPEFWCELQGSKDVLHETGKDGKGHSVKIGLPSKYTDYNLLCWATRRGYADLIMLVELIYRPPKICDNMYYYVNYVLEASDAWKCALWCATQHGQKKVILELLRPDWIIENVDFNDYPWGWLPPLHLVALSGDFVLLGHLTRIIEGKSEFDSKDSKSSGAHKKDYKERIPLDYAMAFLNEASEHMHKKGHKDVVKKLLLTHGVGDRLQELYQIYIDQANTVLIGAALIASVAYVGWLQPPLGYQDFHDPSLVPAPPEDPYMAIEGHHILHVFIVFNALSFFLALTTMFMGVITTSFVHDNHEKTRSLIDMRRSSKWMVYSFIGSMMAIVGAFISAGAVVLPPVSKLKGTMIGSLVVGSLICLIPLLWILWSIREYRPRSKLAFKNIPLEEIAKNSLLEKFTKQQCEDKFEEWDADGDGYISKTEVSILYFQDISTPLFQCVKI